MDTQGVTDQGFTVGDFQIEPTLGVILGPTGAHFPSARTIQLLVLLAEQPGAIISRRRLLCELWPKSAHAEKALTRAIGCLRHSFGDNARVPRYVETIQGQGYRLLAPVGATPTRAGRNAWRPARPSIIRARLPIKSRNPLTKLFQELRRRKVFGATAVYAVVTWLVFQVSEIVIPALGLPDWALTLVVTLGILGFPIVAVMAWVFDLQLRQADSDQTAWSPRVATFQVVPGVKAELEASSIGKRTRKHAAAPLHRGNRDSRSSRGSNGRTTSHPAPASIGSNGKSRAGAHDLTGTTPVSAMTSPGFVELPARVTHAAGSQANRPQPKSSDDRVAGKCPVMGMPPAGS